MVYSLQYMKIIIRRERRSVIGQTQNYGTQNQQATHENIGVWRAILAKYIVRNIPLNSATTASDVAQILSNNCVATFSKPCIRIWRKT